jgi:tetratricopeptide (TPR) repeat protein
MPEPFLRDTVADPEAWQRERDRLATALQRPQDDQERLRLLGRLGDHLRQSPDHATAAIELLQQAIELARSIGHPAALAGNLIRLATAEQYAGRHEQALATFAKAREVIDAHAVEGLRDFACQHMGKCLTEMGRWDDAQAMFDTAAQLRESRGAAGLLASSRQALSALAERRAADGIPAS